jgi:hypothetical protein
LTSATRPTTLVVATTPAADGGAAAALGFEGTTVVGRLVAQLGSLGAGDDLVVLVRPSLQASVEAAIGAGARVVVSDSVRDDLLAVAALGGSGPLVIADGDVVTQREALAAVLDDPRLATGALVGRADDERAFAVRVGSGRVLAAASPLHDVSRPTGSFRGVLRVGGDDRAALAAAARRAADLVGVGGADEPGVAALLLVALVRGGTPVRAADGHAYLWARPSSAGEAAAVAARLPDYDEERLRLDGAVKSTDGWFTTFLVSPYSRHIARWCARRGLTPNQVTTASLALGVLAAVAFATGERWGLIAGAVLLQASFTTDCVDGQLARYTRRFSALGAWLDAVFDRTKEYAVYAGLAIGAGRAGDSLWILAAAALTLQTVRHMIDFSWAARDESPAPPPPLEQRSDVVGGAGDPVWADEAAGGDARRVAGGGGRPLVGGDGGRGLWLRKIVVLPIGERFAAISLTAAIFDAHVTFVVLLAWGGFALTYGLAGRGLRMVAAR